MQNYIISPLAETDLEKIWRYTAENWGIKQADKYILEIEDRMKLVGNDPTKGKPSDDIRTGYFRLSASSHMLFYTVADGAVIVRRVLHQSMSFDLHL